MFSPMYADNFQKKYFECFWFNAETEAALALFRRDVVVL